MLEKDAENKIYDYLGSESFQMLLRSNKWHLCHSILDSRSSLEVSFHFFLSDLTILFIDLSLLLDAFL